jgi:hypothetical protein
MKTPPLRRLRFRAEAEYLRLLGGLFVHCAVGEP